METIVLYYQQRQDKTREPEEVAEVFAELIKEKEEAKAALTSHHKKRLKTDIILNTATRQEHCKCYAPAVFLWAFLYAEWQPAARGR